MGPYDPALSAANNGVCAHVRDLGIITSTGFQVVDVRDLALLHLKLLDLPDGLHRYAAAGEMLTHRDASPSYWTASSAIASDAMGCREGCRQLRVR